MTRATRVVLALALAAAAARPARAQGLMEHAGRAQAAADSGRHAEAVRHWRAAHAVAAGDPTLLYLAARSAARAGDGAAGIAALRQAIADGFVPRWPLARDTTLAPLRGRPGWAALVRQAERAAARRDTALRRELLALAERDQAGRAGLDSIFRTYGVPSPQADSAAARMEANDRPVQARLREIVARRGWPGRTLVGDDAAHAAWLVVQHMPDTAQRRLLPLLQAAARRGEARAADAALLEDRVRTGRGLPQRYGSQLAPGAAGQPPALSPMDRPECVERRRAAVGLPPLASYLQMFGVAWRAPDAPCEEAARARPAVRPPARTPAARRPSGA